MLSFFERLDKFMNFKGLNDNKITVETGISNGIIGKGRKRGALSQDNISKILYSYPELNANWLFTGKGSMLVEQNDNNIEFADTIQTSEPEVSIRKLKTDYFGVDRQMIPLYELEATAGLIAFFDNQQTQVPLDFITVPNAPKCDGALYVRGDSMYPLLKAGDIICYKTLNRIENIKMGEMYLLDIDDGDEQYLTIKYVQESSINDEHIKLVSENSHHSAKEEKKENIRAAALIKVIIRYNTLS